MRREAPQAPESIDCGISEQSWYKQPGALIVESYMTLRKRLSNHSLVIKVRLGSFRMRVIVEGAYQVAESIDCGMLPDIMKQA